MQRRTTLPSVKLPFQFARPTAEQGHLSAADLLGDGTSEEKKNKYQLLLEWHGVPTAREKDEFIGDCPFYDCPSFIDSKPDKFTMHVQTQQWRCFVCGRSGNAPTFIKEIHRNSLEQTTEHHLQELRRLRHHAIDLIELQEMQAAFNPITQEWTLPSWNREGKISNLYIWKMAFDPNTGQSHMQMLASPSFAQSFYGLHRIRHGTNRPIYVLEGHWDYLAMMGILRRLELTGQKDIIAVPGAGTHPERSLDIFNGREVLIWMDNDDAGRRGTDSFIKALGKNKIMPTLIKRIEWPEGLPAKFDVSDCVVRLPLGLRKRKEKDEVQ